MRGLICLGLVAASWLTLGAATPAEFDVQPLAGTWRYDPTGSTELSGWQSLQLVIAVDGPSVTLTWQYGAGRRTYDEVTTLDLSKNVNVVKSDCWPSNRNIGAYMGGDKTVKYKFRVLNDGRLLRTYGDFVVTSQQGDQPMNVVRQYKVSFNGSQLTVTELRNTRDEPLIYVFNRVPEAAAPGAKDHSK